MDHIIQIDNISKKYRITHQQERYVALRDVLVNLVKSPFGFLRRGIKEEFWALKDISFNVEKGEAVGIIGANGAGKSTLLKVLSQITFPTTGEIKIKGSVASLLEVGTGFHPELTGRENVFLNGAILGMTKKEIGVKFKDIVEFAGIEKFIDTPVKRYSSGMHVRLAFSVAAHMDPDILLVDEVLAVGDASFQKKCLGKMDEVTREYGRTILFVSHNMAAIQGLCDRCILLEDGKIKKQGATNGVIKYYLDQSAGKSNISEYKHKEKGPLSNDSVNLISIRLTNKQGKPCSDFISTEDIYVSVEYKIKKKLSTLFIDCILKDEKGRSVFHSINNDSDGYIKKTKVPGVYISCCQIPKNLLNSGRYFISVDGRIPKVQHFFGSRDVLAFNVSAGDGYITNDFNRGDAAVCPRLIWTTTLK